LTPENGLFRIKAEGHVVDGEVDNPPRNIRRGRIAGQGVIIGDKVKALMLSLKRKLLTHRPEKIAYMKPAGRLNTR